MRGFAHSVCAGMEGVMKKGIQRISLLLLVLALVLSGNPGSRKQHIAKAASLSAAQAIKYKIAGGMQDEVESEEPDDEQYSDISLLQIADYSANSIARVNIMRRTNCLAQSKMYSMQCTPIQITILRGVFSLLTG